MGSLRNPVGPLPSSIYWRRRVVLVSVVAVLALLTLWIVTMGGGDGKDGDNGANGKNPAPSITPGPSSSGPAISQAPGGRDESGDEGSGGSGDGSGNGSGDGSEGGSGSGSDGGSGSGGSGGSEGAGGTGGSGSGTAAGGVGAGDTLPAGSTLPNCTASAVKFSLRSRHNTYDPEQTPTFLLTARNVSGSDCKIDLGPKNTVFTIAPASSDDDYWSSGDCPKAAAHQLYRVAAGSGITYTVKWDRKPSAPECATPPAGSAGSGTYLVEAKAPGFAKVQTSFVLSAD
ncbi:hypothetical protein OR263_31705 [Streptomyces sp. NEAU-H22]|uniref:hypothetical protein n=1 Tax=unclassified Streptomyces TaxID=2593676 RepID=UPI002254EEDA|nr:MULTISPECIES: hypothetical protein [unclassified Streptomyces]MCX3291221.1 hypothetical protein [Streptomyces sp. NEAU-H22]WMD03301.1 hypothetical protein Q7C01_02405 [Streptomyces sp. FXY-T5]